MVFVLFGWLVLCLFAYVWVVVWCLAVFVGWGCIVVDELLLMVRC